MKNNNVEYPKLKNGRININVLKEKLSFLNEKKKKKRIIFIIIGIIIIILICIMLYIILNNFNDKKEISNSVNNINKKVIIEEVIEGEEVNPPENKNDIYWDYLNYNMININFNELKSINDETVGWIQVNNTNINYPVVKHSDNEYYLKHQFDKSYNTAGWVFMDYRNNNNSFENKNTIIYGHALKNKAIFGSLKNTLEESWYTNKDNLVIKTTDEYNSYLWQIFSIYKIETNNDYIQTDFINDEDYNNFLKLIRSRSIYNFNVDLNTNDKVLTLSTCHNEYMKLVVHAKMIKKVTIQT